MPSTSTIAPKQRVIATDITIATEAEFISNIFALAAMRKGSYVTFTNVHMLMEARQDPAFAAVVNGADMAMADGAPVAIYLKRKRGIEQPRLPGMDMLPLLLAEAEQREKSVYFYGGQQHVLDAIAAKIASDLPNLKVAGMVSPPFRALSPVEEVAMIDHIVHADPDLIFVALGCPRQEKWMAAHQGQIKGVMLGVGQAFLTFAGLEKRLPSWLRKLPVEWLYRLALEPRRLFKRYFITNSTFLWAVLRGE